MTMTDPIADLLTRIRNAVSINHKRASIPHSRVKEQICRVLKEEGFVNDYRITEEPHKTLHVFLKYGPNGEKIINEIKRVSKPGRRLYSPADAVPKVLDGIGIAIVSTSKGIMSDRRCREQNLGGEVMATVW
ncbi:MAG: 30S ribosomal protein S8 [Planctomycetes bacterium DG_58]|nr:MAG: 30S ribosomal protein S8 [Planctomycetes bacterium DG_58]KPL02884.1 MAG: 30S ribosomal protein S8 [Planctomycetes bacterium SM23_65]